MSFPYAIDQRGRTASASHDKHLRDLIEMVLFTSPGERVNRPTFGCGLLRFLFEPNDPTMAAALEATAHASLQLWLGTLIEVRSVIAFAEDSTLNVTVQFASWATGETEVAEFRRSA